MADYKKTIDFIKSVYGNQEFTPLAVPVFIGNEKKYLNECIDTTFVSSVGKFVDRFENDMAAYTGAKRAVVCVSGTNALHMSLLLVGVKRDDEVLTQALTFIATENALSYIGAYPVFLDVDRSTMGLSPDALKEWLQKNAEVRKNTRIGELDKSYDFAYEEDELACYNKNTGRRIKACVPMHTFGHPVRIEEIAAICKEWHIELVEDAAESIGSKYKGKHTGLFGKIGALSFNGNKTITTGGGGMMLFNDKKLGAFAKHITTQAKIPHRWEFRHDHIGFNYRMPNINAALGCAQLEHIDEYVASKRKVAAEYEAFFKNVPDIEFFVDSPDTFSNYWLNVVILKDKEAQIDFLTQTNDNGVMTRPIWDLMNRLPMFERCENDGLKNTIWFADRVVNIPSSVRLSDFDLPKYKSNNCIEELSYKKATIDDYDDFFKIKCDPENVKWSGFASTPDYERMKEWFIRQIESYTRAIYLCYWKGELCGFFYLDKLSDKDAEEIGYGVLTSYTGRGIGTAIVETGIKLCKASELLAWVSEQNKASERCFEKNDFKKLQYREQRTISSLNASHDFYCWTKKK